MSSGGRRGGGITIRLTGGHGGRATGIITMAIITTGITITTGISAAGPATGTRFGIRIIMEVISVRARPSYVHATHEAITVLPIRGLRRRGRAPHCL